MALKHWCPQETAELERLIGEGLSAGQIARRLGTGRSRNAIIGRISRQGLRLLSKPEDSVRALKMHRRSDPGARSPRVPVLAAPIPTPVSLPSARIVEQSAEARAIAPQATSRLRPLSGGTAAAVVALKHDDCRWPIGEFGAKFRFCCEPRLAPHPYCEEHMRKAHAHWW